MFFPTLLASLIVAVSASPSNIIGKQRSSNSDIAKRADSTVYSGRATFFEPGLGACGGYNSASDFVRFILAFFIVFGALSRSLSKMCRRNEDFKNWGLLADSPLFFFFSR
jgi:hypothetical protein